MFGSFAPFQFTASGLLVGGGGLLCGYTLLETGGASSVTVYFRDETTTGVSSRNLLPAYVGANGNEVVMPSRDGIRFENGLYVEVSGSGTLAGVAYVVPITRVDTGTYLADVDRIVLSLRDAVEIEAGT